MIRFRVELLQPDEIQNLKSQIAALTASLQEEKKRYLRLESRYGDEVQINGQLIDLLREHGIRYRPSLDHKERM